MHRKLRKFDPALITKEFFPDHVTTPENINHGKCYAWAYAAYLMFEDMELWDLKSRWSHAFVFNTKTGKFYDSEKLNGVVDWKELPCTTACGHTTGIAEKQTVEIFQKEWNESINWTDLSWKEIEKKVNRILKRENDLFHKDTETPSTYQRVMRWMRREK